MRATKQNIRVVSRKAATKKRRGAKRKSPSRRTEFKSSAWYQTAILSVAIPLDRRDAH